LYQDAAFVLLDSRFLSHVFGLVKGVRPPVCAGSDLTAELVTRVIAADDNIVLIGGAEDQAQYLREHFGLRRLQHYNPPMGFIRDPLAVEACLSFVEATSPFRYCLLAVGAPQQEMLAQHLKQRGKARGLALCIGASINFLTGGERRAPGWMQRSGMEWLYRLLQDPRRLAKRYLVRGPRIFGLLRNAQITVRAARVTGGGSSLSR
jgi:exopolysaccharide biosynthesis WecB/TagA/CpsF family protein